MVRPEKHQLAPVLSSPCWAYLVVHTVDARLSKGCPLIEMFADRGRAWVLANLLHPSLVTGSKQDVADLFLIQRGCESSYYSQYHTSFVL